MASPKLEERNMKPTDTFPAPEEPNPTRAPLSCFPLFPYFPAEIRAHIWTLAIIEDLGIPPPEPAKPTRTPNPMLKKGEGRGGWGGARRTQPAPPKPPAPEPPAPPAPVLHIIPFHTLPAEAPFASAATYLEARYGANWEATTANDPARRQALAAEAKEAVQEHARARTVLMPPGRAPETLARFSGGWLRSGAVINSCREAEAAAHALGRRSSGGGRGDDGDGDGVVVGYEALVGSGRGDVCCFMNARANGSPIHSRETLPFWTGDGSYDWERNRPANSCHQGSAGYHLNLFPGGEEWVGAARSDDEMPAEVSGLRGLLPALEQREELVVVWHPAMCRHFERDHNTNFTHPALCTEFRRNLHSLPLRYPRLKTIYILDPMIKPKSKYEAMGRRPSVKFRGYKASFYTASVNHFILMRAPGAPALIYDPWVRQVRGILEDVMINFWPTRPLIQVDLLACVPDDFEPDFWGASYDM